MPGEVSDKLDLKARQLLGRSVALAPELERHLILSSRVEKVDTATRAARSVSYDTPYAVKQHEAQLNPGPLTSRKAPTQDGAAGRKYLERPFRNMVGEVQTEVGQVPLDVTRAVVRQVKGRS